MRTRARDRVYEINVLGTKNVMEEALSAGVVRVVLTSSSSAVGAAEPGGTIDEDQPFTVGRLGVAYINSKHEAEVVSMRAAAKGLRVVIVNPSFVLGPDDPNPSGTSNALVRRLLLRRIPGYLDGAINIVDVRDVAKGHALADERGEHGERYLTGRNFTQQRLFADLSRIANGRRPRCACEGVPCWRGRGDGARRPAPSYLADEVRSAPSGSPTATTRRARCSAGSPARTRRPSRTPCAGSSRSSAGVPRGTSSPISPAHRGHGPSRASLRLMSEARRVLYRCGTPTNFLCPCGAVARRLNKLGLDYRTERVAPPALGPRDRRAHAAAYVPVLVDGDEGVNDSRRILQYLDWAYTGEGSKGASATTTMSADE